MRKIAVVDIDNTLWDFASVLFEEISRLNPLMPPPDRWICWDFWKEYVTPKDFFNLINKIHFRQDAFGVFPDARDFLQELKACNFHIIIASHREEESKQATLNWLLKHSLPFDELHLSLDKTVLFSCCNIVIDDSPHILERAHKMNIIATGIEFPWNRDNGFKLFNSLTEIKEFVKFSLSRL
ncbi:MAG: hypothetical protein N3A00_03180 [Thermodesulfovibrio sp.]|nr:hypothetical protein [Thermodesulfovibrio sp.]